MEAGIFFAPNMTLNFYTFPSEIRILIFSSSDILKKTRWAKLSPPLLIALRPDPVLYAEALQVFYGINTFNLDHSNGWTFDKALSVKAVREVQRVYARFWLQDENIVPPCSVLEGEEIRKAVSIRSLSLEFNFKVQGREDSVLPVVRAGLSFSAPLDELVICICHTTSVDTPDLIEQTNRALGVKTKLFEEDAKGYVIFRWIAAKGSKLEWELGKDVCRERGKSIRHESPLHPIH